MLAGLLETIQACFSRTFRGRSPIENSPLFHSLLLPLPFTSLPLFYFLFFGVGWGGGVENMPLFVLDLGKKWDFLFSRIAHTGTWYLSVPFDHSIPVVRLGYKTRAGPNREYRTPSSMRNQLQSWLRKLLGDSDLEKHGGGKVEEERQPARRAMVKMTEPKQCGSRSGRPSPRSAGAHGLDVKGSLKRRGRELSASARILVGNMTETLYVV